MTREIAQTAIDEHGAIQKVGEFERLLKMVGTGKKVLELGFFGGGTHWAFREMGNEVLSIDIHGATKSKIERPHVYRANSHDPETIIYIRDTYGLESFDCLFIDAEHSFRSVLLDYVNFSPMVKQHGVIAFHDICPTVFRDMDTGKPCNVDKAWQAILKGLHPNQQRYEFINEPTSWGGIGVIIKDDNL